MGARPADFDERIVRMAPTFKKWLSLNDGEKLRYACRDFIKGNGNDQERLMRRIMIARRNNLRDHELLKKARSRVQSVQSILPTGPTTDVAALATAAAAAAVTISDNKRPPAETKELAQDLVTGNDDKQESNSDQTHLGSKLKETIALGGLLGPLIRKRPKTTNGMTDLQVKLEMDELAVESTRSYKAWVTLEDGAEFTYNQTYIKGKEGHDWLLKKNIWRRMRYRRQNKKMVETLKDTCGDIKVERVASSNINPKQTLNYLQDNSKIEIEEEEEVSGSNEAHSSNQTETDSSAMDAAAAAAASAGTPIDLVNNAIVEAAVAAAVSYVKDMPKDDNCSDPTSTVEVPNESNVVAQINDELANTQESSDLQLEQAQSVAMV